MTPDTGTQPSQPIELATLVDYQHDSIVSRTLVKRAGGTVTAFPFDAGQALSEHTAPFAVTAHVRFKMLLTMIR